MFDAQGNRLANIIVPLNLPSQNCGFGGSDKHDLHVVGRYVVFYLPLSRGIEVVRVLHGSRDIESIFENERNWPDRDF